jgi:hypothetical protein
MLDVLMRDAPETPKDWGPLLLYTLKVVAAALAIPLGVLVFTRLAQALHI